jgi:hypothetical protein
LCLGILFHYASIDDGQPHLLRARYHQRANIAVKCLAVMCLGLAFQRYRYYVSGIAKLNSKGAAAMSDYLNNMIGYQVQGTAEWRREKARQFPDDADRNLQAAKELDQLAAEIDAVEGSEIEQQIDDIQASINNLDEGDVWGDLNETVSAELRSIGFHGSYSSGVELLEWYRDLLREKLHDLIEQAVPAPDLRELVENDPAVKAAKLAYEQASAKAYAEARKKL